MAPILELHALKAFYGQSEVVHGIDVAVEEGGMTVLLGAVDAGLGACFLGVFRGQEELARSLGVPEGWRQFGAVALGRPDGSDRRSPSLDRPRPPRSERIHRGGW